MKGKEVKSKTKNLISSSLFTSHPSILILNSIVCKGSKNEYNIKKKCGRENLEELYF